jgi:hypothetical protein
MKGFFGKSTDENINKTLSSSLITTKIDIIFYSFGTNIIYKLIFNEVGRTVAIKY